MRIGIDLGGHHIAAGLLQEGKILKKLERATPENRDPGAVIDAMAAMVEELGKEGPLEGIGVGLPGLLSRDRERVVTLPNLKGWEGFPARQVLSERLGLPVALANDCHCAALGELERGAAADLKDFVFISLGTGIGGAVFAGRKVITGARGWAGEAGHIPLMYDAPCGCGGRGHIESFFSADRLEEWGAKTPWGSDMAVLWEHHEEAGLAPLWGRALTALACCLGAITALLDPEAIVIGGGLSNLPGLIDEVQDYLLPLLGLHCRPGPQLRKAALGADGALIGAASLLGDGSQGEPAGPR